jgi:hypothetical protein
MVHDINYMTQRYHYYEAETLGNLRIESYVKTTGLDSEDQLSTAEAQAKVNGQAGGVSPVRGGESNENGET